MPTDAEGLAQRFHETYERLAPSFGYETRKASARPWAEVPEQNRALMVAVCQELVDARLLLPPGGETRDEFGWSHRDGTECLTPDECLDAYRDTRRVTEWPDGTELMTPWRPVHPEGANPA